MIGEKISVMTNTIQVRTDIRDTVFLTNSLGYVSLMLVRSDRLLHPYFIDSNMMSFTRAPDKGFTMIPSSPFRLLLSHYWLWWYVVS